MMGNFEEAFAITKREEGGYSQKDSNGHETAFGLNRQWNSKWDGWSKIDHLKSQGMSPKDITKSILTDSSLTTSAKNYYKKNYYDPLALDGIADQSLVNQAFDFSVNSDYKDSQRNLIKISGVNAHSVDGNVISSLNSKVVRKGAKQVNSDFLVARDQHIDSIQVYSDVNKDAKIKAQLHERNKRVAFGSNIIQGKIQDDVQARSTDETLNKRTIEQYNNVESSGFVDVLKAMWYQASQSNDIVTAMADTKVNGTGLNLVDKLFRIDNKPNPAWQKMTDDEATVSSLLEAYNMPSSMFNDVASSKSEEHFMKIVDMYNANTMLDTFINNNIGSFGKATAGTASTFLSDPTNILLPAAIPLKVAKSMARAADVYKDATKAALSKSAADELMMASSKALYEKDVLRTKRVGMALSGGLMATVPAMKYNTNENYSVEDFMFDTALFGLDMKFLKNSYSNASDTQKMIFDRQMADYSNRGVELAEKQKTLRESELNAVKDEKIKSYHASRANELERVQQEIIDTVENIGSGRKLTNEEFARYEQLLLDEQRITGDIYKLANVSSAKSAKEIDELLTWFGKTSDEMSAKIDEFADGGKSYRDKLSPDMIETYDKAKAISDSIKVLEKSKAKADKILLAEMKADLKEVTKALKEKKPYRRTATTDIAKANEYISKMDLDATKATISKLKETPLSKIADEVGFNPNKVIDDLNINAKYGAKVLLSSAGKVVLKLKDKSGKLKTVSFETKGKKAVAPTALVLSLLALEGTASASGGEEQTFSIMTTLALGALAFFGYKAIRGYGERNANATTFTEALTAVAKDSYDSVSSANKVGVSNNPNTFGNTVENIARAMNNRMIDTIVPLLKSKSPKVSGIARKMFNYTEDGKIYSTERRKTKLYQNIQGMYMDDVQDVLDEAYKVEREGSGIIDDMVNMNHKGKVQSDLRKQASMYIQNPYMKVSPHVKKVAEIGKTVFAHILSLAREAGVDGVKELQNYIPHYDKVANAREILIRGGAEATDKLAENFLNMYVSAGVPIEKAAQVTGNRIAKYKRGDRAMRGGDSTEVMDDISNRFKQRYNMDFSAWKDFTVGTGASSYKVSLDDIMELDMFTILDKYNHEMTGHIALAENGWKKYADYFKDVAESGGTHNEQRELNEAADLLLGRQIIDKSSKGAQAAIIGKNTSSFVMLPFATANMVAEVGLLAFRASKHKGQISFLLNKLTGGFVNHGYDSAVVQKLLDYHSYGHKNSAASTSYRGYYDSLSNPQTDANGFMDDMVNASSILRDKMFFYNAMTKATDLLDQISVVNRSDLLARYVHGKESINPMDLEIYGISPRDEEVLKEVMQLNSKGHLKAFDINTFNKEQRDTYDRIIDNMKLTDIQEHTMGGTPAYSRNSEIGYAFSTLLGFPMQSFSTHGMRLIKGMARMRVESLAETMIWFAGGYAAYTIKHAIQGKEHDEEEAIKYGLMMLPLTAPYSVIDSMTNPVITSTTEKVLTSPEEFLLMVGGN